MKLHHLKPNEGAKKDKKRVARGDRGRGGKTAGRGTKGTGARGQVPAAFEGGQMPLVRRQPKAAGFNNPNKIEYTPINVATLEAQFEANDTVSTETLLAKGLARKNTPVKILGHGELTKPLTVEIAKLSQTARDKITAAGGTVSG